MPLSEKQTLLKNKIEQLLTEARVIIPGAQALLGSSSSWSSCDRSRSCQDGLK